MGIKKLFRAFVFFLFQLDLCVITTAPKHRIDNCVLPKAMKLANKGNSLAMRHISVIFDLEHKNLDDDFYLYASNLWAYLAAQRGDSVCTSKLLQFMREHPGESLPVPLSLRDGAVKTTGDLLNRLCLLPECCNPELFYDLLPLLGGRMYLLRAYPGETNAEVWEDSCFQESLLNRHFKVIPGCYRNYSPSSLRSGKRPSIWQIISMFIDACRSRVQEYRDKHYSLDL